MPTTEIPRMDPEIKALWTAKLRSREFEQGAEYLRRGSAYCCLGVLCHLAGEAGIIEPHPMDGYYEDEYYDEGLDEPYGGNWVPNPNGTWDYGQPGDQEVLPGIVQNWAGLGDWPNGGDNPLVTVPDEILAQLNPAVRLMVGASTGHAPGQVSLAQLNDAKVPFPVIADIIDAAL